MAFDDVLGNNRTKKILKKSLERKRIPNSLLFFGPEGVGKRDVALVLAKAMNCLKKKDDACEICASCRAIENGKFPDVMVIGPEKNVLKIEQMRAMKQTAYLKPMVGRKRVFVVDQAEKMNDEAANSVLKILEEPPVFTHIILITHNPFLILPTIRSRCQDLSFSQISKQDIEKVLVERGQDEEKARIISLLVRGNLKQALNLDWEEVQPMREQAWQLFEAVSIGKGISSFIKAYAFERRDSIEAKFVRMLEILSSFGRDLLLIKSSGNEKLLMNPDYENGLREAALRFSLGQVLEFLVKIDSALYALERNVNVNLLVSTTLAKMMERDHA
ncbi:MAG: DNA polymerase III subunit delta' [Candidatus Aminicenantes bacterium]